MIIAEIGVVLSFMPTVIGADAFILKASQGFDKMHSCGRVIIGDSVEIGASCTIDKGVSGDTVIGSGTRMDNHVHVGHDTVIGKRTACLLHSGYCRCCHY